MNDRAIYYTRFCRIVGGEAEPFSRLFSLRGGNQRNFGDAPQFCDSRHSLKLCVRVNALVCRCKAQEFSAIPRVTKFPAVALRDCTMLGGMHNPVHNDDSGITQHGHADKGLDECHSGSLSHPPQAQAESPTPAGCAFGGATSRLGIARPSSRSGWSTWRRLRPARQPS